MCLECGCHEPANSHGGGQTELPDGSMSHMTTAEMITQK